MVLPEPSPGLVISYSYLWHDQHRAGAEEGRKARPCARGCHAGEDGDTKVYAGPITHSQPDDPHAVENLPAAVKRRLGLDGAPSWIVGEYSPPEVRTRMPLARKRTSGG